LFEHCFRYHLFPSQIQVGVNDLRPEKLQNGLRVIEEFLQQSELIS